MKTNRPSFFQVIRGDGISALLAWGSVISIVIGLYLYFSGGRVLVSFLGLFIGISIIEIVVLFFRYKRLISIFEDGIEVSGVVTEVYIPQGDSQAFPEVNFTYKFQGESNQSRNRTSVAKAKAYTTGQSIIILLDRNNPKRAFVKELFLGGK